MSSAVVYSRPGCQACRITTKLLKAKGVDVVTETLSDDDAVRFRADGHMSLPVVVYSGRVWSGLRPDVIAAL